MNPAKISIPDCTLDTPVKKSSGKISFCLLPCLHNNERLQVKLATRFKILKVDKSEQEKIYAKIYPSKLPTQDFSCRFWQVCTVKGGRKKKEELPKPTALINMPLRGQVVFSVKHLFCGNVKTITCIVDEVLVEEVVQASSAFDDFEDRNESDLEEDEEE